MIHEINQITMYIIQCNIFRVKDLLLIEVPKSGVGEPTQFPFVPMAHLLVVLWGSAICIAIIPARWRQPTSARVPARICSLAGENIQLEGMLNDLGETYRLTIDFCPRMEIAPGWKSPPVVRPVFRAGGTLYKNRQQTFPGRGRGLYLRWLWYWYQHGSMRSVRRIQHRL